MEEITTLAQLAAVPDDDFVLVEKTKRLGKSRLHKATCHLIRSFQNRIGFPHTNSTHHHVGRNEEQPLLKHRAKKCKQCFTKQSNPTLGWKTHIGDPI